MDLRRGTVADAGPIAALIASFQPELTVDPSGAGAEQYLASLSEQAEREYLESPQYFFIIAECGGTFAGFIAIRDNTRLFDLFVARAFHRNGLARRLWREARGSCPPRKLERVHCELELERDSGLRGVWLCAFWPGRHRARHIIHAHAAVATRA
jgi:GNAT superfamily N-acetyltransferase